MSMADELFTCRVREHHIGKRFEDVREEDWDFVRWVLLQVEIRNHNLRSFAQYCRAENDEELALIAAAEASEADFMTARAVRLRALVTDDTATMPLLTFLLRASTGLQHADRHRCGGRQRAEAATLLAASCVCKGWLRVAGEVATPFLGPVHPGVARKMWLVNDLRELSSHTRRSQPPWYVDAVNGDDNADGMEATPLRSVERAEQKMLAFCTDDDRSHGTQNFVQVLRCDPETCTLSTCDAASCKQLVCKVHGFGIAHWVPGFVQELSFIQGVCGEQGCTKAFCKLHHSRQRLSACDVCQNGSNAAAQLGACNHDELGPPQLFCKEHLRHCHGWAWRKRVLQAEGFLEADDDDEEGEEGENSEEYGSDYSYDEDGGAMHECGFDCCPQCFQDHKCGDDPTQYC
jgi:hypothetical protein